MILVLKKGATEREMKAIRKKLRREYNKKGVDLKKYGGTLKLKEDPLIIQYRLRGEW